MRLSSRGDAPEPLERAADRNNAARRSSRPLLDPHGIYGTRTASRRRTAQRRQSLQSLSIVALVGAVVALVLWWTRQHRVPTLHGLESRLVAGEVSAPPTWNDGWIIPTASGELVRVAGKNRALFAADFALRAQPESGDWVFAASEEGTLFALDSDLKLRWKYRTDAPISSRVAVLAPAVARAANDSSSAASLVLVADDSGTIAALRANSGVRVWQKKLGAAAGDGQTLAPAGSALDGRVWVPLGAGESGFAGGVACLDARDGRVLWRVSLGAASLPAPALDAARGTLFCVADSGAVFCLDARTGRKIWKTFAAPLVQNGSGVVLRAAPTLSPDGARVFIGGNDGTVRCLAAAQGVELWRFETAKPVRFPVALDAARTGTVWCANDGVRVWALDAASGAPRWKIDASAPPAGAPHISANTVELVTRQGRIETFAVPQ